MLDDESPTTNLENDHGFIIKEYYLHWYEAFSKSSKAIRAYAQSGQFHTIVESRVRLTIKSYKTPYKNYHTLLCLGFLGIKTFYARISKIP